MGEPSDASSPSDRTLSWAKTHASDRSSVPRGDSILPTSHEPTAGARSASPRSLNNFDTDISKHDRRKRNGRKHKGHKGHSAKPTHNEVADRISNTPPPPAPPPPNNENESSTTSSIGHSEQASKLATSTRLKNSSLRFVAHTKNAICHSYVNVLLVFVPIGIAVKAAGLRPEIVFAMNAIAIVPLAGLLSLATESVAKRLGDTLGALLNVSFGNAVELIIFIIALVKNEIAIVKASLLGSILANLLLILGMAFLLGGLRYREQIYNSTVTQMSAVLLSLSVMSLLLPTAFHASFATAAEADSNTLIISRGTSVILLLVYILYLLFQLKSHAYMYESTPQRIIDEESHPGVLADMLGSSSSSSSSDSSSSDDSDSSDGSHTTAKRIKRVLRIRRKSSASSKEALSLPSMVSSPNGDQRSFTENGSAIETQSRSRNDGLFAITSGDEADVEDRVRYRDTVARDFETQGSSKSPERKRKKKKHQKKKRAKIEDLEAGNFELSEKKVEQPILNGDAKEGRHSVGFADEVQIGVAAESTHKRPFNLRQLSTRPLRPQLPTLLSNNVFSTAPRPGSMGPGASARGRGELRRTNSLPDRLNQRDSTPIAPGRAPMPYVQQITALEAMDEDAADNDKLTLSRTAAVVMLLASTALVALCAEFLVDAIPEMIEGSPSVNQAFIGLIILPIVGNAAEHVTAVTVATKNKMDLAIGVAVGSSIQIAIFVTPLIVILGWILDKPMSLYFNLFETVSLFVTAFVVNFLVLDGRSNYLEGALLIAAYTIIAVGAFFYPDADGQSALGGFGSD